VNALIFTISIGHGHNQVASSIKEELLQRRHSVLVIDALEFVSPFLSKVLLDSYLTLLRYSPETYGRLYEMTSEPAKTELGSIVNNLLCKGFSKIVTSFKPDVVICTHSFATALLAALKKKLTLDIPLVAVITDYSMHNSWIHSQVDKYVYATEQLSYMFDEHKVSIEKRAPLGIPIRPAFTKARSKESSREKLSLKDMPTLLFMGGSLGMGTSVKLVQQVDTLFQDAQIIVVAGKNDHLFRQLSALDYKNETRILGYTENVADYMSASDLLVSKPGGITVTEALCSGLPMALVSPIPGQEEHNSEFLVQQLVAVHFTLNNLPPKLKNLFYDSHRLGCMSKLAKRLSKPRADKDLSELLEAISKKR
jgi:processive 1,2-diacylglycerol beta-glucosyltransferase